MEDSLVPVRENGGKMGRDAIYFAPAKKYEAKIITGEKATSISSFGLPRRRPPPSFRYYAANTRSSEFPGHTYKKAMTMTRVSHGLHITTPHHNLCQTVKYLSNMVNYSDRR
jgi:hypothetical protein